MGDHVQEEKLSARVARGTPRRKAATNTPAEHKRLLLRLRDALALNQTILAASSAGMLAYVSSGRCVFANEAAGRVLGTNAEELMRQDFRRIASWKESGLLKMALQTLRTGKPGRCELSTVTTFGRSVWLDCHLARFVTAGRPHLFLMLQDFTVRKQGEAALRTLSLRLQRVQDQERRRIARALHDSTAQKLTALALNLSLLKHGTASARRIVRISLDLAEDCAAEVRTISHLLHPPLLDQLGLAAACRDHVQQLGARTGIRVKVDIPDQLSPLSPEANLAIFRVVQEGLANVVRHSGSQSAAIRLQQTPDEVHLELSDHGHGLPPAPPQRINHSPAHTGLGLIAMRERVAELNGQLHILSSKHGTTLRVTLPLGAFPP